MRGNLWSEMGPFDTAFLLPSAHTVDRGLIKRPACHRRYSGRLPQIESEWLYVSRTFFPGC